MCSFSRSERKRKCGERSTWKIKSKSITNTCWRNGFFFFFGNLTMVLYREADHVDVASAVALEALTTLILTSQGCAFGLPKPSRNSCLAPSVIKNRAGTRHRSGWRLSKCLGAWGASTTVLLQASWIPQGLGTCRPVHASVPQVWVTFLFNIPSETTFLQNSSLGLFVVVVLTFISIISGLTLYPPMDCKLAKTRTVQVGTLQCWKPHQPIKPVLSADRKGAASQGTRKKTWWIWLEVMFLNSSPSLGL